MDLSKYKFPKPSLVALTTPELVAEAERRTPEKGIKKFNEIFYNGGKVTLKPDVSGTWKEDAWKYCKSVMGSWGPSHEDKEIVCGMLIEECLEL